jgi:hypothetical protein
MDPTRVILDCDTANEVDDQFAIAHALGVPEGTLDVRGVISVHNTTAPHILNGLRRKPLLQVSGFRICLGTDPRARRRRVQPDT